MATSFRFVLGGEMSTTSIGGPANKPNMRSENGELFYEFHNVNPLEPFSKLPAGFCEFIASHVVKVSVMLEEDWATAAFRVDAERFRFASSEATCIAQCWTERRGYANVTFVDCTRLWISGPTLESVLSLIFAMKRGEAQKVGDPTFTEYAKQSGIPYSALKKSRRQQLRDWWKKVKIGFLNYVKPLPIPRDAVND